MENQSFINQWTIVNSYEGLGATMMPIEAAFPDDDLHHYLHHQLPIKAISVDDYFHTSPQKQLKAANSWGSCIIEPSPSPEPHSNFSASGSAVAASFFYPANPTGAGNIKQPKQDTTDFNDYDYDGHVAPKFTLDRSFYPVLSNDESIYAMNSGHRTKRKASAMSSATTTTTTTRSLGAQDHVIAERKRREKLNQRFIALSAIVPGLKKTDKASVLADATKYLKQLQERVKILEDQTKSKTVESVALVKKSKLVIDEKNKPFSATEPLIEGGLDHEELPEIEARMCDKDVLIRVHCDNKKGVIEKILCEILKLQLSIVNTSVLAFGSSALDITIVAQMDAVCCMTVKELVKSLHAAFSCFM